LNKEGSFFSLLSSGKGGFIFSFLSSPSSGGGGLRRGRKN